MGWWCGGDVAAVAAARDGGGVGCYKHTIMAPSRLPLSNQHQTPTHHASVPSSWGSGSGGARRSVSGVGRCSVESGG